MCVFVLFLSDLVGIFEQLPEADMLGLFPHSTLLHGAFVLGGHILHPPPGYLERIWSSKQPGIGVLFFPLVFTRFHAPYVSVGVPLMVPFLTEFPFSSFTPTFCQMIEFPHRLLFVVGRGLPGSVLKPAPAPSDSVPLPPNYQ